MLQLKPILLLIILIQGYTIKAQKIDSIYVNLYTDSLKKGTYNYINVDGLMSNGRFTPLDSTKINFTCTLASFYGNSLFIPINFTGSKVNIKVSLKANPNVYREFEVYIKKNEDPPLKTQQQVLDEMKANKAKRKAFV